MASRRVAITVIDKAFEVAACAAAALLFTALFAFSLLSLPGCSAEQSESAQETSRPSPTPLPVLGVSDRADDPAAHARLGDTSFSITLGFAGDINLADNYLPMQNLAALGSTNIVDGIDPAYIELMRGEDLMWVNNEFVFSDRGEPLAGKAYTFRAATANVRYLGDMGVDIVGLANNHTFDYGEEAFLDTLSSLENAGIPYVGAGRDFAAASAPVYLEVDGFTIAYVAASRAEYTIYTPQAGEASPGILWCYDNALFLDAIREAAAHADYVVALPHWGVEHSTVLEAEQTDGAHAYIDAGADAVIGAHPHILQGLEFYNGKPIVYSLGNFWFDNYDIDTMVAEIRIEGEMDKGASKADRDARRKALANATIELALHPGTQSGCYTALANTPEWRDRIFRHLESISAGVWIDDEGIVHSA